MEGVKQNGPLMATARRVASALATACLVFLIVASGFTVCAVPDQTTRFLARNTGIANPALGFSQDNMVDIASATRDYAFGSHDKLALQQTIYDANDQAQLAAPASRRSLGAPELAGVDRTDIDALDAAFDRASERFCYSSAAIAHLDDCFALATHAYTLIAVCVIAFVACLIATASRRERGRAVARAGWTVLVAFGVLGIWAAIDFNGLFSQFHRVFFSQGNWTFPTDSLLICALPTDFWMGMGLIWLATSIIASILSILIGNALKIDRTRSFKMGRSRS